MFDLEKPDHFYLSVDILDSVLFSMLHVPSAFSISEDTYLYFAKEMKVFLVALNVEEPLLHCCGQFHLLLCHNLLYDV